MNIDTYRRQRGAATLIATVILVVIASLTVLVVNKSAINEQQRSGVDARSKEVYAAANGALEYGISQLMILYNDGDVTTPVWDSGSDDGMAAAGDFSTLGYDPDGDDATDDAFVQGIDSFGLSPNITYTLITAEDEHPAIIEITAPVVGANESHVTKTISMRVLREDLGGGGPFSGPPLIVEKCIPDGAALGTPDITSDTVAVATIRGDSSDGDCLNAGHFSITGGGIVGEPTNDTSDSSLVEALFGSSDAVYNIQEAASIEEAAGIALADRGVIYVTETTPWGDSVGSLNSPVILFFSEESGCPAINGGTIVFGLVYYEAPDAGCDNQGTGSSTVFGTVAYEGDLTKINANIEMVQVNFGTGGENTDSVKTIAPLPGSWRDFSPAGI
ncbi:MAG: hypothetical protein AB9Q22_04665 [Candidatus Reddybacter sp.]